MQCLILAGGLGTRMKAVTGDKPKALLPAGPRTFIDWQLLWLARLGVTEAVLALGHQGKAIQTHVEQARKQGGYPAMKYVYDGPQFLGTGGAIRNAAPLLKDTFIVTYGDSFLLIDVRKLYRTHEAAGAGLTLSILENQDKGDKSNVLYANGKLERYDKFKPTPDMRYIDYGMLVVDKAYFLGEAPQGKFDLAQVIARAVDQARAAPFVVAKPFYEIGSPNGYRGFCELLAGANHDLDQLLAEVE